MRRRDLIVLFPVAAALRTRPLIAQGTRRAARIGLLRPAPAPDREIDAFRETLGKHGFVAGRNCELVLRWGDGNPDHLFSAAAALVSSGVDVIVGDSLVAAQALQAASVTTPIVMAGGADPVRAGLAKSLARPGGNVTGITGQSNDLIGKCQSALKFDP